MGEQPSNAPSLPSVVESASPGPPAVALRGGMMAVRLRSDLFCSIPGRIICFVLESKRLSRRFRFISAAVRRGGRRMLGPASGCFPLAPAWSPLHGPLSAERVRANGTQLTRLRAVTETQACPTFTDGSREKRDRITGAGPGRPRSWSLLAVPVPILWRSWGSGIAPQSALIPALSLRWK